MICIYIYENLVNGKVYIGQTNNIRRRDLNHILGGNKKVTIPIDCSIKKYGRDNFSLNILTEVDTRDQSDYAEMDWISRARELLGKEAVYNICDGGAGVLGPRTGQKCSEEHKNRISRSLTGHVVRQETKDKISVANSGKKASEETKQKMSEQRKGENSAMYGKTQSDETKKKISQSKRTFDDEQEKEIKAIYNTGNFSLKEIAQKYSVGVKVIFNVVNRQSRNIS